MSNVPLSMIDAVLDHAHRGWHLFPVHSASQMNSGPRCSCGDPACEHTGKHPRTGRGFHDATTDEAKIRGWWTEHPNSNIGVATGATSGFAVLDIDPRHGGDKALDDLVAQHGPLPPTVVVETGGGGLHFYFALDGLEQLKNGEVVKGILA